MARPVQQQEQHNTVGRNHSVRSNSKEGSIRFQSRTDQIAYFRAPSVFLATFLSVSEEIFRTGSPRSMGSEEENMLLPPSLSFPFIYPYQNTHLLKSEEIYTTVSL